MSKLCYFTFFLMILSISPLANAQGSSEYDGLKPIFVTANSFVYPGGQLKYEIYFNRKIEDSLHIAFGDSTDLKASLIIGENVIVEKEKITIKINIPNNHNVGNGVINGEIGLGNKKEISFRTDYTVGEIPNFMMAGLPNRTLELNKSNRITAMVIGYPYFKIETDNGKIYNPEGLWFVEPDRKGICRLSLFINDYEGSKIPVVTYEFNVE